MTIFREQYIGTVFRCSDPYTPDPYIEWEVPKDLFLHTDQLIPPLEIGFERLEKSVTYLLSK